ncbi:7-carboxy-7-deazaguanine synthase QueE [bacterium]|nr:7-carboxy-7-deazaguanine synthase QueE [bacterium]
MLKVSESFYSIQGEGIFTGVPAVFLRLTGCNLTCGGLGTVRSGNCEENATWRCDTIEVWTKGETMSHDVLCSQWETAGWMDALKNGAHVVVTGGEPVLQSKALASFMTFFKQRYRFLPFIELETNGTLVPSADLRPFMSHYNVSFKTSNSGMKHDQCFQHDAVTFFAKQTACTYKFVINTEEDINDAFTTFITPLNLPLSKVCFMPAADNQKTLTELEPLLIEWCKQYRVRYSTRLHIAVWDRKTGV